MQDTYALLGTVAVAFCNRVGNEEGLTFWGGSRLLAADGSTIAEGPLYEEALVVGALETDDLRMQRYSLPLLADERLELNRRELDRIIAERAGLPAPGGDGGVTGAEPAPLPQIDAAQAMEVITGFIRLPDGADRLRAGWWSGLSGGVDSATVAFLAVRADRAPTTCWRVRMPYRTSSPDSEADALRRGGGAGLPHRAGRHQRPWSTRCWP